MTLFRTLLFGYPKHIAKTFLNRIWTNPLMRPNIKFKGLHKGETCYILGSGPSIKTQDLTKLKGKIVMTQNHFHAHEDIKTINPKYHVIVPKYQPKSFDDDWHAWIKSMEERLPNDTTLFAGTNTKYIIDEYKSFDNRAYYMSYNIDSTYLDKALVDITKNIMYVPTVITQCLAAAIYMGFKEIYLLGFDLNQVCIIQNDRDNVRFYGNSQITNNEAEKKMENDTGSNGEDWFKMWVTWHQLNLLNKRAKENGTKIINATNGGLLDMFPREKYEDIIKKNSTSN